MWVEILAARSKKRASLICALWGVGNVVVLVDVVELMMMNFNDKRMNCVSAFIHKKVRQEAAKISIRLQIPRPNTPRTFFFGVYIKQETIQVEILNVPMLIMLIMLLTGLAFDKEDNSETRLTCIYISQTSQQSAPGVDNHLPNTSFLLHKLNITLSQHATMSVLHIR